MFGVSAPRRQPVGIASGDERMEIGVNECEKRISSVGVEWRSPRVAAALERRELQKGYL